MNRQLSKNFNSKEFDSPDEKFSGLKMDFDLIVRLQQIRNRYKKPIIINSGYRTKKHNKLVGGKKDSAHLVGKAVDIQILDSRERFMIAIFAFQVGFNRIGISKTFIHLDVSRRKDAQVLWLYN